MKKFKNKKLLIVIIILVILILAVGIVLALNLKSSNKELFFKYASQIFEEENGFIDDKINEFNEKKKTNQYENNGKITFNVSLDDIDNETKNSINDFNITFAGNVDSQSEMIEELIKINYAKNINFPIMYKKVGNIEAIKLNKIMQKYISAIDFNIDTIFNGTKSDLDIFEDDLEENGNISSFNYHDYIEIIKGELEELNFSKVATANSDGYSVKIDNSKLKVILEKILDKIKTDNNILSKLKISSDIIEKNKDNILDQITNEGTTTITLYQKDGKLNKIIIQVNDELKIEILKVNDDNKISYNISVVSDLNEQNIIANIDISYEGLQELEQVTSNYNIDIDVNDANYVYNFKNEVRFTNVEISDFEENEYVDINKLSSNDVMKLFKLMSDKFVSVNNNLMEEAKITPDKFLKALVPYFEKNNETDLDEVDEDDENVEEQNEDDLISEDQQEDKENKDNENNDNENNNSNQKKNLVSIMDDAEKEAFNNKYEAYDGDSVRGSNVKQLMMSVIANNMADEERQIKVTGDITLTGDEVPEGIEASKKYTVKLSYSDKGYVNEVNIKENN